jgi:hypothetical protein
MRNTTKLKNILYKYVVSFELTEDEQFVMILVDINHGNREILQAKSYSLVISKAYSFMLRELKKEESLI